MQGLMTELEAVNKILAVAGDSPVQTLEDDYIQSKLARQVLERASRHVQGFGWWFNEEEVSLSPDIDGFITLGTNVILCEVLNDDGTVIQRGNRLYDRQERTYVFTQKVDANITLALNWNELPQVAREHIVNVACSQYNNDFFGAQEVKAQLNQNEALSLIALKKDDTDARDINLLHNARSSSIAFKNRRR